MHFYNLEAWFSNHERCTGLFDIGVTLGHFHSLVQPDQCLQVIRNILLYMAYFRLFLYTDDNGCINENQTTKNMLLMP